MDVVARNLWLRDAEVDVFAGAGPLITDDRPRTEYHLLRRLFATDTRNIDEAALRQAVPSRPEPNIAATNRRVTALS